MAATKQAAPQRPGIPADRQRHAQRVAYLGCAAALGYGVLKLVWSLGGTIGLRHHERLHVAPAGVTGLGRLFDYWGTPILAWPGRGDPARPGLPVGQRADRAARCCGPLPGPGRW